MDGTVLYLILYIFLFQLFLYGKKLVWASIFSIFSMLNDHSFVNLLIAECTFFYVGLKFQNLSSYFCFQFSIFFFHFKVLCYTFFFLFGFIAHNFTHVRFTFAFACMKTCERCIVCCMGCLSLDICITIILFLHTLCNECAYPIQRT